MNERIDQLLVKAGAYFGGEGIVYDNFDPKKFAELIVRECFRVAVQKENGDTWDYNSGRSWAGIDILKHFGVEE